MRDMKSDYRQILRISGKPLFGNVPEKHLRNIIKSVVQTEGWGWGPGGAGSWGWG
jgi:nitrogen fixation protein